MASPPSERRRSCKADGTWRNGRQAWLLREIAARSPVLRSDLIAAARAAGLASDDDLGPIVVRTALIRLRRLGLIFFGQRWVQWRGRARPVTGLPDRCYQRFHTLAPDDPAARKVMRDQSVAKLQAERDAELHALRAPGAPIVTPDDPPMHDCKPEPRRPVRPQSNDRVRVVLARLNRDVVARALQTIEHADDRDVAIVSAAFTRASTRKAA